MELQEVDTPGQNLLLHIFCGRFGKKTAGMCEVAGWVNCLYVYTVQTLSLLIVWMFCSPIGANDGEASSVWMSVRRRARRGYLQEHCYHLVPVSQPAVLQVQSPA